MNNNVTLAPLALASVAWFTVIFSEVHIYDSADINSAIMQHMKQSEDQSANSRIVNHARIFLNARLVGNHTRVGEHFAG